MPLGPGSRLDAYEIVRPLGSGGMGEVWLATEVRLGRKVALKVLPPDLTQDPLRVQRFEQEARAASALNHPNVCTIHALGQTSEGQHYIAMEYVEGETLRQRLSTTRLSIREALDFAIQVAAALSAAHAAGIAHRDIKPENVMLRPDGIVKVLDFGLAKLAAPPLESAGTDATRTVLKTDAGLVVGTAAYMSPEQTRGQEVDTRTDIWSLGVMLYELVAGRSPFAASSGSDVLAGILDREPAPLARFAAEVPQELQRIVSKALRKNRSQRYQTTQDLLLDLQTLAAALTMGSGVGVVATIDVRATGGNQTTSAQDARHSWPSKRHKVRWTVIAFAVASAVTAIIVWSAKLFNSSTTPSRRHNSVLTRLTANSSEYSVLSAVISPDGKYLAYSEPRGIQIRAIETGETALLPDTEGLRVLRWTPDETKVVASQTVMGVERGFEIAVVRNLPRKPRSLYTPSPDGSRFLTVKPPGELWVSAPNTPNTQRIDHLQPGEEAVNPQWTWDSQRIIYVRLKGEGRGAIAEISLAQGTERELVEFGNDVWFSNPTPLPDNRVAFVSQDGRERTVSISTITPSLKGAGPLLPERIVTWSSSETNAISFLSVTRDGRRLAFTKGQERVQTYVARLRRGNSGLEVARRLTNDEWSNPPTAWTDASQAVIFDSNRQAGRDIFKQRLDQDTVEALVTGADLKSDARVTPDGKWLLYVSLPKSIQPSSNYRLLRVPITGGDAEELLQGPDYPSVRCAAGGPCIMVRSEQGKEVVALMNPDGKTFNELLRTDGGWNHVISPDGKYIAYVVPGGHVRIVTTVGHFEQELSVPFLTHIETLEWAADGSGLFVGIGAWAEGAKLVYVSRKGSASVLYSQPLGPFWCVPSPDGKYLALPIWTSDTNVWMLENF